MRWWTMPDLWDHQRSRYSLLSGMDQGNMRTAVVVGDNSGNRRRTNSFRSTWALSSLAGRFCPRLCSQIPSLDHLLQHKAPGCSLPAVLESLFQSWDSPYSLPSLWILLGSPGSVTSWNSWACVFCLPLTGFQNAFKKTKEPALLGKKALEWMILSPLTWTTTHQNSPHLYREHLRLPQRVGSLTTRCHE